MTLRDRLRSKTPTSANQAANALASMNTEQPTADEFSPMDDPELFMEEHERKKLAMHRAMNARNAKLNSNKN